MNSQSKFLAKFAASFMAVYTTTVVVAILLLTSCSPSDVCGIIENQYCKADGSKIWVINGIEYEVTEQQATTAFIGDSVCIELN